MTGKQTPPEPKPTKGVADKRPQALLWGDEAPAAASVKDAPLFELRRHFWSKIAPPIYDTRVIEYQGADKLSWD